MCGIEFACVDSHTNTHMCGVYMYCVSVVYSFPIFLIQSRFFYSLNIPNALNYAYEDEDCVYFHSHLCVCVCVRIKKCDVHVCVSVSMAENKKERE